jgi:hypothetical protein
VTPFDPDALLAMLLAFYPTPSAAALAQAYRERPDYFAGGTLIGSKGDKLQLGDGRVFDLIFAAGGLPGQQRWQVIEATDTPGASDDPFALQRGPLIQIFPWDAGFWAGRSAFESYVAGELGALAGTEGQLDGAAAPVLAFDGAGALEDSFARLVDPAAEAHGNIRRALDEDDPIDELGAAADQSGVPGNEGAQYVDDPPPDLPVDDPGPPPGGDDGPAPGPPQA